MQLRQRLAAQLHLRVDRRQLHQIGDLPPHGERGATASGLAAQWETLAGVDHAEHRPRFGLARPGGVAEAALEGDALGAAVVRLRERCRLRLQREPEAAVAEREAAAFGLQALDAHARAAAVVGAGEAPVAQAVGLPLQVDVGLDEVHAAHHAHVGKERGPVEGEAGLAGGDEGPVAARPGRIGDAQPAQAHDGLPVGVEADLQVVDLHLALRLVLEVAHHGRACPVPVRHQEREHQQDARGAQQGHKGARRWGHAGEC